MGAASPTSGGASTPPPSSGAVEGPTPTVSPTQTLDGPSGGQPFSLWPSRASSPATCRPLSLLIPRSQEARVRTLRAHEDSYQEIPLGRRQPQFVPQPAEERSARRLRGRGAPPLKRRGIFLSTTQEKKQILSFKIVLRTM